MCQEGWTWVYLKPAFKTYDSVAQYIFCDTRMLEKALIILSLIIKLDLYSFSLPFELDIFYFLIYQASNLYLCTSHTLFRSPSPS